MVDLSTELTIIALAWNEADDLGPCFDSLQPLITTTNAKTLIVLDEEATSQTVQIANEIADMAISNRLENFSQQRNFCLDIAKTKWVLFIDPDERATSELCDEISEAIASGTYEAWQVPRRNFFFGKELKHTGWSPDFQIRLFLRESTRYDENLKVHECPVFEGQLGTFDTPLLHINYRHWHQFIRKQKAYSPLEAQGLVLLGYTAKSRSLLVQPVKEFTRRYIKQKGWRDGALGFILSASMAVYKFDVYKRMNRIQKDPTVD